MFLRRRTRHSEPLDLHFGIVSPRQRAAAGVAPAKLIRNLEDDFATPQLLLREALFQIQGMNRVSLSPARRLKLCLTIQRRVWSTLSTARDTLRKHDDGVPEPQMQQELLDLADQLVSALSVGDQIVIEGDYRPDDRHGRSEHARILEAGVRILELVHLQQRLRALRYQPLPATSWRLANTLFCILSRADDLETPVAAVTDDRLVLDAKGNTQVLRLYRAIQSFGLFDTFCWCKPRQHFLDSYCAMLPNAVCIRYAAGPSDAHAAERSTEQPSGHPANPPPERAIRFAHAQHNGPPTATPLADERHRILIDFSVLAAAVRADKQAGKQPRAQRSGDSLTRLSGVPPLTRRPILRSMLRSLERERMIPVPASGHTARHIPAKLLGSREEDVEEQDFRLETGMERITQHLQAVFTSDAAMKQQMLRNDVFAGRASTMRDDATSGGDSGWNLIRKSAHHVLIQTRETRYTKQIALGTLAIYGVGQHGFTQPRLGTIKRIVRVAPDSLYVEIKQLARFAAMVSIAPTARGRITDATPVSQIPCLLVYDDDLEWCIVLSPPSSLPLGCPIQIRTRRLRVDTGLRKLMEVTPHLLMFQLDAQSPRLGTPRYPDTRRQRSQLTMASHLCAVSNLTDGAAQRHQGAS